MHYAHCFTKNWGQQRLMTFCMTAVVVKDKPSKTILQPFLICSRSWLKQSEQVPSTDETRQEIKTTWREQNQ